MKINEIKTPEFKAVLCKLYGETALSKQLERYEKAYNAFIQLYKSEPEALFTVAGRTEILGNHTDHNHGVVLAASVNLDIIAFASPRRDSSEITVKSEGFEADRIDISETEPLESEKTSSAAIIRGVYAGLLKRNRSAGGFVAYTTSDIMKGSGLSSSAAFEDMIGTIENHFYNGGNIGAVEIAQISQFAENEYFGKPCGLMDQIACASGGFSMIDFRVPEEPVLKSLSLNIGEKGLCLCIVDTGGSHVDLGNDYASVPAEMKAVARALGKEYLRQTSREAVIAAAPALRRELGDRCVLRALHFFDENERVEKAASCIECGDICGFLSCVSASGASSACVLENLYSVKDVTSQGIPLAAAVSASALNNAGGAFRVHGGGFAGTLLAFVPKAVQKSYTDEMEKVFGVGAVTVLGIRDIGAAKLL